MKYTQTFIAIILSIFTFALYAQNDSAEQPYIEIDGTAELEVMPNQIFISITIKERHEGKEKITIEQQESKLKQELSAVGIELEQLTLSDANADYVKIKRSKSDVISQKQYWLKVTNANEVSKAFQAINTAKIKDAYISKVSHSKLQEYKKEVKIMAIKAAKNKADYLLEAIGEETGKPIIVRENNNIYGNYNMRSNVALTHNEQYSSNQKDKQISFKKIKLTASIYVKFLIK